MPLTVLRPTRFLVNNLRPCLFLELQCLENHLIQNIQAETATIYGWLFHEKWYSMLILVGSGQLWILWIDDNNCSFVSQYLLLNVFKHPKIWHLTVGMATRTGVPKVPKLMSHFWLFSRQNKSQSGSDPTLLAISCSSGLSCFV